MVEKREEKVRMMPKSKRKSGWKDEVGHKVKEGSAGVMLPHLQPRARASMKL